MTVEPRGLERPAARKQDADYVFFELTRTICPTCRRVLDGHVLLRQNKVYLRRTCPEHGRVEALIYGDAEAYVSAARFNKPGTIPLTFSTEVERGCPYDCGLCPDHQQHTCLGIIEINSACNMACPLCFADAGPGFSLTLSEVEDILDGLLAAEGNPEMVQFSGGEPTIHPELIAMLRAARARGIPHVMINTNGKRIAQDDGFLADLAELRPSIYFQFDGFDAETYQIIRGEPDILAEKLRALDRLAAIDCDVILVPAVERGVNEHELGRILRFALDHPAVRGVNLQPAFHAGRFADHDPLRRITIPDLLRAIEAQTEGLFTVSDFVPVPCCFPTCNSVTYAYVDGETVTPLPRLLKIDDYLDYVANRILLDAGAALRAALEGLWSSSVVPGSEHAAEQFRLTCTACDLPAGLNLGELSRKMFMVMLQDFMDPWTFNQKNLMKCCKEILLPDGKQIPFCAYNTLGYREQARAQLIAHQRERRRAEHEGRPYQAPPLRFSFDRPAPSLNGTGGDHR